ncbi:methyltransferase domain-containing protein [Flavobacterium sp. Fl-77]|uniref:Methyltransferase domain-containing protein n=1 Tax=Flavobacterium flavipigmentatum TaxID=2893884 RepID=A0AAJ2SFK8_9FLAO|nr:MULTISPECIES: methyltransferase domain-containing protein [unclassified Flavobacterium]MDX6182605.1 methyltransferase domain-containing protein [Flavobacterium sp. Fl-33]MDX6186215.1 methyltransferase domain-containing protein [Flavobacterium sp. Fl-77]UFH38362.1 methyltransferase domain-containing protein [Flavobacterium sp. F-70]
MDISTQYRTQETEIMDDFLLEGEELRAALDQIANINQLLGGNRITLNGVKKLLKKTDITKTIVIADIGCGNGDMLRMLAQYGLKHTINFKLIGIDANEYTINYAKTLSDEYSNIEYACIDIFSEDFKAIQYDIVLCTLTLHHFTNEQILNIITIFSTNATTGIIVNDLHRSKLAYRLFEIVCTIFNLNRMSREDGLVSILRGFKKTELEEFSKKLNLKNYTIYWKWAFRYQWIITKK